MTASHVVLPTPAEMRERLSKHRFINSPGFKRAIDAANRKADELEAKRKREAVTDKLVNWNPPAQRQLDNVRKEISLRMAPYLGRLLRR